MKKVPVVIVVAKFDFKHAFVIVHQSGNFSFYLANTLLDGR
ncbi:MAG TPA: hypothetical protein VF313_10970 [Anaerolineaceae bacterium]